jgi:hypothetical protein
VGISLRLWTLCSLPSDAQHSGDGGGTRGMRLGVRCASSVVHVDSDGTAEDLPGSP